MSTRPTPFGMFAGLSVGSVVGAPDARPLLRLPGEAEYRRHVRLDVGCLRALGELLRGDDALRERLLFFPNSSAYQTMGQVRYVEARGTPAGRTHHLVAAEASSPLLVALDRAAGNGARVDDLVASIVATSPDVPVDDAWAFVKELIEAQLLVSELEPIVTVADPLSAMVDRLEAIDGPARPPAAILARVHDELAALSAYPPGELVEAYDRVEADLGILGGAGIDRSRLFRVELVKPADGLVLPERIIAEIARGVDLLYRVGGSSRPDAFARFREDFQRRYGQRRDVALCEVTDNDVGIGFSPWNPATAGFAPLLDGLALPHAMPDAVAFGDRDALLLQWITAAERNGDDEIVLGPDEVDALEAVSGSAIRAPLPDSLAAIASLLALDEAALAAGDYRVLLRGASGPSGANLLGRLCRGDDALARQVAAHLRDEEALRPDAVFAEIVHLPEDRIADVMVRPRLRSYEIPFLAGSGAPPEQRIPVTDLLVSVVGERVLLTSRRLGCPVVPRLSTAHNFAGSRNLALYQFLCALQDQDVAGGLRFSFGAVSVAPRLPRVVSGRLILSPARWNLTATHLGALRESRGNARRCAVQDLRVRLGMPRFVSIEDGDNLLPIDLDDPSGVDLFVESVKGRRTVTLVESFLDRGDLAAHGPGGRFAHDLVIPFVRTSAPEPMPPKADLRPPTFSVDASSNTPVGASVGASLGSAVGARCRPPGSEWLFAKLYSGPSGADTVLRQVVAPAVERSRRLRAVDEWFFVRYADPDWHVRLRMRGDPERLRAEVMPILFDQIQPLLAAGVLWRIQLDTYERELERYGGPAGTALSERIFHADSAAVMRVIQLVEGDLTADDRWRLALIGMDRLFTDLGLDVGDRLAVVRAARDAFASELRIDARLRRQLDDRFRRERVGLEQLMIDPTAADAPPLVAAAARFFEPRSRVVRSVAAELASLADAGELRVGWRELAGSHVHMHANRILGCSVRAQEFVLYDLLSRLYWAWIGRSRTVSTSALSLRGHPPRWHDHPPSG